MDGLVAWLSNPQNSNLVRSIAALIAIPGGIWGCYLFWRWRRGRGIDAVLDGVDERQKTLEVTINEIKGLLHDIIAKIDLTKLKRNAQGIVAISVTELDELRNKALKAEEQAAGIAALGEYLEYYFAKNQQRRDEITKKLKKLGGSIDAISERTRRLIGN
jgi:hypothetical protein